jgi:hypothetical protein
LGELLHGTTADNFMKGATDLMIFAMQCASRRPVCGVPLKRDPV